LLLPLSLLVGEGRGGGSGKGLAQSLLQVTPDSWTRRSGPDSSLPPCGGGPGWGVGDALDIRLVPDPEAISPHPIPPPQGGREPDKINGLVSENLDARFAPVPEALPPPSNPFRARHDGTGRARVSEPEEYEEEGPSELHRPIDWRGWIILAWVVWFSLLYGKMVVDVIRPQALSRWNWISCRRR
jgi:hypothetical protein